MKLRFVRVFGDAIHLWQVHRDVLVRVASVFIFLPLFAVRLFLAPPATDKPEVTLMEMGRILSEWLAAHWPVMVANMLIQTFGAAVLLVMLLDPARPPIERAMQRALPLVPLLLVASLAVTALTMFGLLAAIVGAFYVMGRTFLTGASLVAGPSSNPFEAVANGIKRTRGHGWMLLGVSMTISVATIMIGGMFDGYDMHKGSAVIGALMAGVGAAISTAGSIAMILTQVAAYRGLGPAKQGI